MYIIEILVVCFTIYHIRSLHFLVVVQIMHNTVVLNFTMIGFIFMVICTVFIMILVCIHVTSYLQVFYVSVVHRIIVCNNIPMHKIVSCTSCHKTITKLYVSTDLYLTLLLCRSIISMLLVCHKADGILIICTITYTTN